MKMFCLTPALVAASMLALSSGASAAYNITQQSAAAPTYSNLLTFDEPGTPTGLVSSTYWQSTYGLTITDGVNGPNTDIDDFTGIFPSLGTGNSNLGFFGIYIAFDSEVTSMSFQAWDPSGSPDPFGDGLTIVLLDQNDNALDGNSFTGAWGGIGDTWFNITTSGGSTFRKAVIFNNSFDPETYIDNLSWSTAAAPAPGALSLLGLAGLVSKRRRRV
ncbi:MAG TPA: hypothetical protein VG711_10205 [Phycisphaerales bacterium]|nr:hypothetical protein [Phycisphaerales bacterium]